MLVQFCFFTASAIGITGVRPIERIGSVRRAAAKVGRIT